MLSSEEIKSEALSVVELCLSEAIILLVIRKILLNMNFQNLIHSN